MLKFSRCGISHLVFPFCSIMPGVPDQPPCLGWLEQLLRFDWNEEMIQQYHTGEKVSVPAVVQFRMLHHHLPPPWPSARVRLCWAEKKVLLTASELTVIGTISLTSSRTLCQQC